MGVRARIILLVACCAVLALAGGAEAKGKPKSGKVFAVPATTSVPGTQFAVGSAIARCPKGSHVISGGWQVTASGVVPFTFSIFESLRIDNRSWKVVGIQPTSSPPAVKLIGYAYCRRVGPVPSLVTESMQVTPASRGTVLASCPNGSKATAGGFRDQMDIAGDRILLPTESRRTSARGWNVGGEAQGGADAKLDALAYCTPKVKKLGVRSASVPGPTTPAFLADARAGLCPKATGALSGGFLLDYIVGTAQLAVMQSRRFGRNWQTLVRTIGSATDTQTTSFAYCP